MLGERNKRPAFAPPAQPRTPTGRLRGGYLPGRRRCRLPRSGNWRGERQPAARPWP